MDQPTRAFDNSQVEETYNWHDDVMEITRRIVHETDEARLSNIANHFEVDLSEIRSFIEIKQQQQRKPKTNSDCLRAMTDEELARWIAETSNCSDWCILNELCQTKPDNESCISMWLDWLKEEVKS